MLRNGVDWTGELRAAGLAVIGRALGLAEGRGASLGPCPACGAERRGREDRRGPLGLRRDGLGWRCHRCNVHGDAVTLASLVRFQAAAPRDREGWAALRAWAREAGLIERSAAAQPVPALGRVPARPVAARRPPSSELETVWSEAMRVGADEAAMRWLRARGIDPAVVETLDLARVIRQEQRLPDWAQYKWRSWRDGHRLIVGMVDETGARRSLHARSLEVVEPGGRDKAASPSGYEIGGLIMVSAGGLEILRGGAGARRIVVAEGVPDFLWWACRVNTVIGLVAGAWSDAIGSRIETGCQVEMRAHLDAAGDAYYATLERSIGARVRVERMSPKPSPADGLGREQRDGEG